MSMKKVLGWGLMVAGTLLAVVPAYAQETDMPLTLDEEYARLAEEVPGFGGLYLDADGTTHVYLVDLSREREVQGLGERVVVQQGDYDFGDLLAWKDELRPQLRQRGVVFLDISERHNRLVLGVERTAVEAFTAGLEKFLRGTRVPPEAVVVEVAEPIVPLAQLTDGFRPVPGGVQIQNQNGSSCTVGVNATRQGVRGFVTASHCTETRSVVEGTDFFQTAVGLFSHVGVETVDPPFFIGGSCPSGRRCRFSDTAFVAYDSPSLSQRGQIANPLFCNPFGAGPLTVDALNPRVPVNGFIFGTPASGSLLAKVGRTTGCTTGTVDDTCVDVNVVIPVGPFFIGTDMTMLCQSTVTAAAAPGDSGERPRPTARSAATRLHARGSEAIPNPSGNAKVSRRESPRSKRPRRAR
jgi:hypothetical protein